MTIRRHVLLMLAICLAGALALASTISIALHRNSRAVAISGRISDDAVLVGRIVESGHELLQLAEERLRGNAAVEGPLRRALGRLRADLDDLASSNGDHYVEGIELINETLAGLVGTVEPDGPIEKRVQRFDDVGAQMRERLELLRGRAEQRSRSSAYLLYLTYREAGATIIVVLLVFGVLIYTVQRWSSRQLIQPVQDLASAADRAMRTGASFALEEHGPAEVRALTRMVSGFVNRLEETVTKRTEDISRRTRELEKAVNDRKRTQDALLERSRRIELLQAIAIASNEATNIEEAMSAALVEICRFLDWPIGHVYLMRDPDRLVPSMIWHLDDGGAYAPFVEATDQTEFMRGEGLPGRAMDLGHPVWVVDVQEHRWVKRVDVARRLGLRSAVAVPVLAGQEVAAVLEFFAPDAQHADDDLLEILGNIGTQLGRVTEREVATRRLREACAQAESANEAKSHFLANISHEIRTPMNGIIGMTELALEVSECKEQRSQLDTVLRCANSLLDLLNEVLDFSKIEAGAIEFEHVPFSLHELVEDVLEVVAFNASRKGLELIGDWSPVVPQRVVGDPTKLRQVLLNLLGNAIKFTADGEVCTGIDVESRRDGKVTLRFSVSDSGIGIPRDRISAIFDTFTQADGATARKYGGTGLGLAICKRLVEGQGGEIWVDSSPGQGSTFHFTLELESAEPEPGDIDERDDSLTDKRVLVVDDNATNRYVLEQMLQAWGCHVECVADGEEALARLTSAIAQPYDFVLLDQRLPGMDGTELGRIAGARNLIANTRVIILTSAGSQEKLFAFAYRVLPKPARRSQLFRVMIQALNASSESGADDVTVPAQRWDKDGATRRVLIVDDNGVNRHVCRSMLQRLGIETFEAEGGREAVDRLAEESFDLILMDVQMPGMDGLEATRILRTMPDAARVPIVALTAHALSSDRQRCLDAGMNDYMSKPISQTRLSEIVRQWLNVEVGPGADPDAGGEEIDARGDQASEPIMRLIDIETALDQLDGDRELFFQVLASFVHSTPGYIEDLLAALRDGDAARVAEVAHSIKGSAAAASVPPMWDKSSRIEKAAAQGVLADVEDAIEQLRTDMKGVTQELVILQGQADAAPASDEVTAACPLPEEPATPSAAGDPAVEACRKISELDADDSEAGAPDVRDEPICVLVVDDNPTNRALCVTGLSGSNCRVLEASDGLEALAVVEHTLPDVIIMDLMMPGIDGLECARRLRGQEHTRGIPIIMLSSRSSDDDVLAGLEAGANEYLAKPFNTTELALRVESMAMLNRTRIELLHSHQEIEQSHRDRGEQARALSTLLELSCRLSKAVTMDEIVEHSLAAAAELTDCTRVSVMLPDEHGECLRIVQSRGIDRAIAEEIRVPIGEGISGKVFRDGESFVANAACRPGFAEPSRYESGFFVSTPLLSKPLSTSETVVGVLNLTGRIEDQPFTQQELDYLDVMANLAGTAISGIQNRESRDSARDSIVIALATLAEHRDTDTGSHLDRVTQYALLLADDLRRHRVFEGRITAAFRDDLRRSMPLHDIGKVAVTDKILFKPDRLSESEMNQMKRHTEFGAKAIRSILDRVPGVRFLAMAEEITIAHHEWYDGSGYPRGLHGEEIPLSARIAAVADVYDALTTERPYKPAFTHAQAVEIISGESGRHFDPRIVDSFLRQEQEFARLARELADRQALPA